MLKKEYAVVVENDYPWSGGAPCPFVVSNGLRTALIYYMQDSIYSGKTMSVTADMPDNIALVEFELCKGQKFEGINDEVFHGHPLLKNAPYVILQIKNSQWMKEMEKVNSVHDYYDPEHWKKYKHYLFAFHDEIFHCVTRGFNITPYQKSYDEMIQLALSKVHGQNTKTKTQLT